MSFIDGTIGRRRTERVWIRFTPEEKTKLKAKASYLDKDISSLIRDYVLNSPFEYVKNEITNAIDQIRNGYQKASQKIRQYFTETDDNYRVPYSTEGYGISPIYG